MIGNRDINTNNNTAPILSFYQFSLEPVNKETAGLTKWTVSGKDITVTDTRRTFAENLSSYQGKTNVFHIKPTYNASTYDWLILEYDLSADYAGKKIGVEMSFDAWINKPARVAWQMLIAPDYQLVCGYIDETYFLSANTWHTISGNAIVDVPSSGKLYLSPMQINGAEAYFANATLTITEGSSTPDTAVTLNSVIADGSASSKTTQLTLTFSQAITGLNASNINLGSEISGLTKGTLSGSGPTYTLPITGFTAGGSLSVSVSKLGYNITPSKTVTIYGGSGSGGGGGDGSLSSAWFEPIGSPATAYRVINGGTPPNQVVIPATYNGLPVTAIGSNAFVERTNLTSVTIPNSVTVIGMWAFDNCTNLTSVTFNGTISSGNFSEYSFRGDLRTKYLAGGTGTYTTTAPVSSSAVWTKQGGGGGSTDIQGTWQSTGGSQTLICTATTWTFSVSGYQPWSGTYTISGNTANFIETNGNNFGTGTISGNSMALQLPSYGNYTLTKRIGGDVTWTAVGDSKFGTSDINAIAYSGTKFVAVGASGKMAYSTDGTSWTAVADSKLGSDDIYSIAYGNGTFVAGGGLNNKLARSSDGMTWTAVADSKFGSSWIYDIAYGNGKFVAVGSGGTITYSTDNGVSWTDASNSTIGNINSITYYSGGRFVAVGIGKIAYSDNGTSWTVAADCKFGSSSAIYGIAYGGGKFIAVGAGNPVYSTDNGVTWTTINLTGYASYSDGITYGNNEFIAWGNGIRMVTSPDGLTWTATGEFGNHPNDVAWGSNKFVAVGTGGKIAYSSGN